MKLIEGLTTIMVKKDTMDRKEKENEMNLLFMLLLIKILSIAIVSYFLWPRVIPEIFTNVKPNPGFLNILGLSIIIGLLI